MRIGTALQGTECVAAIVEGNEAFLLDGVPLVTILNSPEMDPRRLRGTWWPLTAVTWDVPIRPSVVLCTGHNYLDHFAEKSVNRPSESRGLEFFLKAGQTIAKPSTPLVRDDFVTRKLDQETELGVVIGREAFRVGKDTALEHVYGYIVVNDVTARDRQVVKRADGSFTMELGAAKNFVGSTRLANTMVTSDEVGDPQRLLLETRINGSVRQRDTTANMLHSVAEIVSYFSSFLPLTPGTIISTGTPAGSGWGQDTELGGQGLVPDGCTPGAYLLPGDHVESVIEKVGSLEFTVSLAQAAPHTGGYR